MAAEMAGESVEHLAIKGRLLSTINAVDGWTGEAEVWVQPKDRRHFVADVVARPDAAGRRPWTFEVQLSRQSRAWATERTADRSDWGNVNWLTIEPQSWSLDVPSLVIDPAATAITGGIYEFGEYQDEFRPVPQMDIHAGIGTMLADRYRWIETIGWVKPQPLRRGSRKAQPATVQGDPDDACEREPVEWEANGKERGRGHFSDDWGDADWEGRSRMAAARRHSQMPLDWVDLEALRRYPE